MEGGGVYRDSIYVEAEGCGRDPSWPAVLPGCSLKPLRQCGLAVIGCSSSVLTLPPPAYLLPGQCLTLQILDCNSSTPPASPHTTIIII